MSVCTLNSDFITFFMNVYDKIRLFVPFLFRRASKGKSIKNVCCQVGVSRKQTCRARVRELWLLVLMVLWIIYNNVLCLFFYEFQIWLIFSHSSFYEKITPLSFNSIIIKIDIYMIIK